MAFHLVKTCERSVGPSFEKNGRPCHGGASISHPERHARLMLSPSAIAQTSARSLVMSNSSSAKMSAIDASLARLGELHNCMSSCNRTGSSRRTSHSIALCHHVFGTIAASLSADA